MKYYLGVDGGGTKTEFLLTDENGHRCSENIQPTTHYLQTGLEMLTRIMAAGADECMKEAGIDAGEIARIFVACGGYGDVKKDCLQIDRAVGSAFGQIPLRVGNDSENALAGALAGEPGINLIAGTGSMASGIDRAGHFLRCGGWHQLIGGDEGGAFWMAMQLFHEFSRQSDGRDEKTLLYRAVRETLQLTDDYEIINLLVVDWAMDRTRIASYSKLVMELARKGDPYAENFFRESAKELCDLACTIKKELKFADGVPCSGTGGIFRAGDLLISPLKEKLEKNGICYVPAKLDPASGSVVLAMKDDNLAISSEIISNMKQ